MSFGLNIWSASGVLEFDMSTATYRIVISVLVSYAGEGRSTKTFQAPGCTQSNSVCFMLPIDNNNDLNFATNRQLECEMGNQIVSVRNFLAARPSDSFSQATMRLIVMRWG